MMKTQLLHDFLFLGLITSLSLPVALSQQCDVVVTSQAALRKDLIALLDNLDVHVDGNISCLKTCNGIEGKVDALEAILNEKMNEVL
jgi:predicted dinucleotide-utilizing enzyme